MEQCTKLTKLDHSGGLEKACTPVLSALTKQAKKKRKKYAEVQKRESKQARSYFVTYRLYYNLFTLLQVRCILRMSPKRYSTINVVHKIQKIIRIIIINNVETNLLQSATCTSQTLNVHSFVNTNRLNNEYNIEFFSTN